MKSWIYAFFFATIITLFCTLVALAVCGCQSSAVAQAIQQAQNKSQVDIAAEKAKAALAAQKAKDNPVAHPIAAATAVVKEAQKPLGLIATISFLVCAAGVGLYFTPLSAFSRIIVPVAGGVSAFSFFGLIALPFFPWVGLGLVVAVIGLFVYEVIRAKSLKGGIADLEADIVPDWGVGSTAVPTPSTAQTIIAKLSHL